MGKIYQIDILKSIKIFEKNLTIFGILIFIILKKIINKKIFIL